MTPDRLDSLPDDERIEAAIAQLSALEAGELTELDASEAAAIVGGTYWYYWRPSIRPTYGVSIPYPDCD